MIFFINFISDKGPKTIKIFQNLTKSLDFDSAESMAGSQEFE
jgi:hypothetical protein